jgi:hypothetical protein
MMRKRCLVYFVYYESIKRDPKIRGIYECRCDERLQTKSVFIKVVVIVVFMLPCEEKRDLKKNA